jgi:hypothetical protein
MFAAKYLIPIAQTHWSFKDLQFCYNYMDSRSQERWFGRGRKASCPYSVRNGFRSGLKGKEAQALEGVEEKVLGAYRLIW